MDIRFISSPTDHDEDRFAPVVLRALANLLSKIPVTYVVRIETTDGRIFQRSRTGPGAKPIVFLCSPNRHYLHRTHRNRRIGLGSMAASIAAHGHHRT